MPNSGFIELGTLGIGRAWESEHDSLGEERWVSLISREEGKPYLDPRPPTGQP